LQLIFRQTALAPIGTSAFFVTGNEKEMLMVVVLNGKEVNVTEGMTILALLESKDVSPQVVVVERNGDIVPGENFGTTSLNDGDHLEVLRFVGGG